MAIKMEIDMDIATLATVDSLYAASNEVERDEFTTFVRHALEVRSGVQALEWIPRVGVDERGAYEDAARVDGFPDFAIRQRGPDGSLVPVDHRVEYYPVYFVEPLVGNEAAVGFDLASNLTRKAALIESRDSGREVATGRVTLVQEAEDQYAFLVFHPVYRNGSPTGTMLERRENLTGFVLGVYRIGEMLTRALDQTRMVSGGHDLRIQLFDMSAPFGERALTDVSSEARGLEGERTHLYYRQDFDIAGRTWAVVVTSDRSDQILGDVVVLLAGVLLTMMMSLYLISGWRRTALVERTVTVRTGELVAANLALEENVVALDAARFEQAAIAGELGQLIDTAVDGIITIDEAGIILSFNLAAETIFGYMADEVIGKNVSILMPEPDHTAHDAYLNRYLESGRPHILGRGREVTALRKNGDQFPMDLAVNEYQREDRRIFTGIVRDITDRRQVERMKDEFVSTVSHELRTPLTSLRGSLGLMTLDVMGTVSDQGRQMLDIAVSNTDRLIRLINEILDVERMTSGEMPMDRIAADSALIVAAAVDEARGVAEVAGITVVGSDLSIGVWADPDRIVQTLSNLIGNAVKFSPAGTEVLVSMEGGDGKVTFSVSDQGRGIEPENLESIFERFHQIDSSDTREMAGTGLGLAICRLIVEQHGGRIWAESVLGEGSTFFFTLPMDDTSWNRFQSTGAGPAAASDEDGD
ncbi:MAG: CHASE domain-containing protein [Acidimicrobiia bacterium]|nr:CHASE domain-containing protein [Actinomycetota bacterium]MBL6925181.1 CHASE domain-containing protein [Acidimicrobiia bacterium]MBL6926228.1 CHASE domain-containing protein [Acidimicrobiia bacterium]